MSARKQIVILGGGVGALTAAYWLSAQPGWQRDYDITVYQMGWRLGGKGASSRNPERGGRIEEHGLHVWFGFYENAFTLMRSCYGELARPAGAPLADFEQAFKPRDHVWMLEERGSRWLPWHLPFPPRPGAPGLDAPEPTDWSVLTALVEWLKHLLADWLLSVPAAEHIRPRAALPATLARRFKPDTGENSLDTALTIMRQLPVDEAARDAVAHAYLADRLREFRGWTKRLLQPAGRMSDSLRRLWLAADLGLTAAIGMLEDGVLLPGKGLQSIDDLDFTAWLRRHGADPESAYCTPVRALYDCCFAFSEGDTERPSFAAGAALGCALRIGLMYRGHLLYEMQAGMGDTVIAPLYEVLAARGVRFAFFQRVRALELNAERTAVARIRFGQQATVRDGRHAYQPLVPGGLPYWPSAPRYEQLLEGERLRGENLESHWTNWRDVEEWTLELDDGDRVVLGISLGALPGICGELARASAAWHSLLHELPSIQTQSMQLWMTRTASEMRWSASVAPTMVAAPEPHNVWADMSHLLSVEEWQGADAPRSIQYFCGPLKGDLLRDHPNDPGAPARAQALVRRTAVEWLEKYTGWLLPGAARGAGRALDWNLLHADATKHGDARLDEQWLRANIDPSERYVLSPPRVNSHRLPSHASGFANLVLAGDWTRTAINAGCVEAAVMSGMAAARALCGHPRRIHGEGFMRN
jgi:uncharacterized protein with NAD-binding domain and iron-sulfur cluster